VQLADFRRMIDSMVEEIPPQFLEGIAGIEVSPRVVLHPGREGVYTLGECIPIAVGGDDPPSRVVLYHGSFAALAREAPAFDWRGEAWETLTHELRHHLEWKANAQDLEEYDWAADQSFARADDESFDPLFYISGELITAGTYQVDDDVFIDRVVSSLPGTTDIEWAGKQYRIVVPPEAMPLYLVVEGVEPGPVGDLVIVFRHRPGLMDLFRGKTRVTERTTRAEPIS
jgi:hypothetical protein